MPASAPATAMRACALAATNMDWSRSTVPPPTRGGSARSCCAIARPAGISTLPLMCQHCADPPCVDVCPTGASFRRADGIVLVDKHTCIGLPLLRDGLPLPGARIRARGRRESEALVAAGQGGRWESCNLCVHRVDGGDGREPACVEGVRGGGASRARLRRPERPESPVSKALARGASAELRPTSASIRGFATEASELSHGPTGPSPVCPDIEWRSRTAGRIAASSGNDVADYDASNGLRSARPQPWKSTRVSRRERELMHLRGRGDEHVRLRSRPTEGAELSA